MSQFIETVYDLETGRDAIRRRAYGVIEVAEGCFQRIVFRPWPKLFSNDDVSLRSQFSARGLVRDACRLYFNQPMGHRSFLALKYIVSNFGTTLATIRRAMLVLDQIAGIKRTDAIVAHVASSKISDRLMNRWGWERHLEQGSRRQFIKRFYGTYPVYPPERNEAEPRRSRGAGIPTQEHGNERIENLTRPSAWTE